MRQLTGLALLIGFCMMCAMACSTSQSDTELYKGAWKYPRVHADGRALVDEHGRTMMMRGINVGGGSKVPPFIPWEGTPQDPTFDTDLARFMDFPAGWGMNVFRLTVFWEAVEPQKGKIDEAYLALVEKQVKSAAERGVYVFIDFHQDLFSRYYGGSGAPAWVLSDAPAEPPPLDDNGWYLKVFSDKKVLAAFDRFWSNADGIRDDYVSMVATVSARFKDQPNVLGIDLMNEPNPGAAGKADLPGWYNQTLIPFYKRLAEEIRKSAPHFVVFIEPSGLEAGESGSGPGWTITGLENYVLSPHYYYPIQFITGTYDGNISALRDALKERDSRSAELGVPILLSEYGFRGLAGDTDKNENAARFIRDFYRVLDETQMHGTIWTHEVTNTYWNREDCSFVNGDWSERTPRADAVARPYAEFTSGEPVSFTYDTLKKRLEYHYKVRPTGEWPTVLRLPRRHYSGAPVVKLAFGRALYVADKSLLLVYDEKDGKTPAEQVVEVTP